MHDVKVIEKIEPSLAKLMPRFMRDSYSELEKMRNACRIGDTDALMLLGHKAKGTAAGYHVMGMSEMGLSIENAAREGDVRRACDLVEELAVYLEHVEFDFGA